MALYRAVHGSPDLLKGATQNGFVESFNGRMRDELLNGTLFFTVRQARAILARWVKDYNT